MFLLGKPSNLVEEPYTMLEEEVCKISINIEDCHFIENYESIERNSLSPTASLQMAFDKPNVIVKQIITVRVDKIIDGISYSFISAPLNVNPDVLKLRMELYKDCFVIYKKSEPNEYIFQLGAYGSTVRR